MARPGPLPDPRRFLTNLIDSIPSPPPPLASTSTAATSNPNLFAKHSVAGSTGTGNPLRSITGRNRNIFLTLHVLFPNELLPALDLLDRNLVTRFRIVTESSTSTSTTIAAANLTNPTSPPIAHPPLYFVQSAQQQPHHHRGHRRSASAGGGSVAAAHPFVPTPPSYEVRLHAWSCSCPAFAFAAYPAVSARPPAGGEVGEAENAPGTGADSGAGGVEGEMTEEQEEEEGRAETEGGWEWAFGGCSLGGGGGGGVDGTAPPVCKHLLACVLAERCALFAGAVAEREVTVAEAAGWAAGWGS